jgi:hypothetical protein
MTIVNSDVIIFDERPRESYVFQTIQGFDNLIDFLIPGKLYICENIEFLSSVKIANSKIENSWWVIYSQKNKTYEDLRRKTIYQFCFFDLNGVYKPPVFMFTKYYVSKTNIPIFEFYNQTNKIKWRYIFVNPPFFKFVLVS